MRVPYRVLTQIVSSVLYYVIYVCVYMGQSIRGEIEANANDLSMEDALLKGDETNAMFFHLHWTIEACDGFSRCSDLLG